MVRKCFAFCNKKVYYESDDKCCNCVIQIENIHVFILFPSLLLFSDLRYLPYKSNLHSNIQKKTFQKEQLQIFLKSCGNQILVITDQLKQSNCVLLISVAEMQKYVLILAPIKCLGEGCLLVCPVIPYHRQRRHIAPEYNCMFTSKSVKIPLIGSQLALNPC